MTTVGDLFHANYGTNLELNKLTQLSEHTEDSVNFVSRTMQNNGVSAIVRLIPGVPPIEAGVISVAAGGTVLESYVQLAPFYSGRDLYYLKPKTDMSFKEKVFYCLCIRKNRYRYNYGRQANRTLRDIEVPDALPPWLEDLDISEHEQQITGSRQIEIPPLPQVQWRMFEYEELFKVVSGSDPYVKNVEKVGGTTNYVTATAKNNGISAKTTRPPSFEGNMITVARNGSVGEAFYQAEPFCATGDIRVLKPKFDLNPCIAMFLITLIRKEKYRYNYGRKFGLERMKKSVIKLPVALDGRPDWSFMESYIKSFPASSELE